MIITVQEEISSGDSFEVMLPPGDSVMNGKKDLAIMVKASGGATSAPANVTLSLSVWADIGPQAEVVDGALVDTTCWVNITASIFRPDLNATVSASTIDFTGTTKANALLNLNNLNADRVKFVVGMSAAPDATPGSLIIKGRLDSV